MSKFEFTFEACLLGMRLTEPALLGRPSPSEASLGCKADEMPILLSGASAWNAVCNLLTAPEWPA